MKHRPTDEEILDVLGGWSTAGDVCWNIARNLPDYREPNKYESTADACARVLSVAHVRNALTRLADEGHIAVQEQTRGWASPKVSKRLYASLKVLEKTQAKEQEQQEARRLENARRKATKAVLTKYADEVELLTQEYLA